MTLTTFRWARVPNPTSMSRFLKPPCNLGRSDFPSPVLTLASSREAFPKRVKLKRSLAYLPTHFGLPLGSS